MSRLRAFALAAAAGVAVLVPAAFAHASDSRSTVSVSFFAHGNARGNWDNTNSSDPGDRFSIHLYVGDSSSYAGATLQHAAEIGPPPNSPSFKFSSDQTGPTGGSPRLVMLFTTPAGAQEDIELTPDASIGGKTGWQSVGDGYWAVHGGSCIASYHDTYSHALGCMQSDGGVLTAAYFVSDSGWLYPSGYNNWIDEVQYDNYTLTAPKSNAS